MIENIKKLATELHPVAFGNRYLFKDRAIEVGAMRPAKDIAAAVAVSEPPQRAGVPSLLRLEEIPLNLELAHGFHRGPQRDQTVAAEVVVDAVEHEVVRLPVVAIRKELGARPHVIRPRTASDRAGCRITDAGHPRTQDRKLREVPAVQREISDGLTFNHLSDRRSIRFEQRRRSLYFDGFVHLASRHREVDLPRFDLARARRRRVSSV